MREIEWKHLADALREYGEAVLARYREKLIGNGRPTQENTLVDTAECILEVNGTSYEVSLSLQDYWKYVENGTKPHTPPFSAIRHWVEVKPLLPRPMANGKLPTPNQLAWMVVNKISREGTRGTFDLAESVEELNEEFVSRIMDAMSSTSRLRYDKPIMHPLRIE